jgi:hypothetical protein
VAIIRDANNNGIYDNGEAVVTGSGSVTTTLVAGTYYIGLFSDGQQLNYYGRIVPDFAGNTLGTARPMAPIDILNPPTQTFKDYIEQNFGPGSDVNDFYRFDLPVGYNVTLKTTGVSGEDLSLALIKDVNNNGVVDSGDVLATSNALNSPNEQITRSLGAGRYFVRVMGINGSTNYTLTAKFAATDPDDTIAKVQNNLSHTLSLGQHVDFTMSPRDDVDLVKFTVAAGQRVSIDVDSLNGSNLDTYLRLFKADGTQLAANNDGAAPGEAASKFSYLEYVFAQAGTYYVGVSLNPNKSYNPVTGTGDVAGGTMGTYRLSLNNLGTTSPTILRVDAGGPAYIDGGGRYFEADNGFSGGTTATNVYDVAGTTDDLLYYSRHSGRNFTYSHAVANGTYTLSLYFAESTYTAVGQRKFDVFAEGVQILNDFDIVQAAGGAKKAVVKTFTVTVNDGRIDLRFAGVVGDALVSAISLVKV